MNVFTSTYSFENITADNAAKTINGNTITLDNQGGTDATINGTYKLQSGTSLILGGRINVKVFQPLNIVFDTGVGKIAIITETII